MMEVPPEANAIENSVFAGVIHEDLVPFRDEDRPRENIYLDFSGLLNPPLQLKQDLKEGCGGKTWPAGMALADYLMRCRINQVKGKTMLVRSKLRWNTPVNPCSSNLVADDHIAADLNSAPVADSLGISSSHTAISLQADRINSASPSP